MVYFAKWKVVVVLLVCLFGVVYSAPNLVEKETSEAWRQVVPSWMPARQINLGLDLRGGSQILLGVEWQSLIRERLEGVVDALRTELRTADIGYLDLGLQNERVGLTARNPSDVPRIQTIVAEFDPSLEVLVENESGFSIGYTEAGINAVVDSAVAQSIEIVRRRIDQTGTAEPTIQRQGRDRILVQLPGVDDPERIKSLLGQTARLTFQMVDEQVSPQDVAAGRVPPGTDILPLAQGPDQPDGAIAVRRRVVVSGDTLVDAQASFQQGLPVVSFRFDSVGTRRFGDVTRENVDRQLAIVLDGKVISAPRINSPILGGIGIIEGTFTVQEVTDLALLLRAGALPAPLIVLEERTVGPGLGADSIAAGETAAVIGFILVVVAMIVVYGFFGLLAGIALIFNLTLIVAALSALQATLTLPGIAGITLTLGMAVDANVLIFERIKEESRLGRTPISAIDAGYSRALTTIIDSNLTTLIASLLMFMLGSGPVKGFAVTLSIGILSSMFTAIMLTRLFVVTWLRRTKPKAIPL